MRLAAESRLYAVAVGVLGLALATGATFAPSAVAAPHARAAGAAVCAYASGTPSPGQATNAPCVEPAGEAGKWKLRKDTSVDYAAEVADLEAHAGAGDTPQAPAPSWSGILGTGSQYRLPYTSPCRSASASLTSQGFCFSATDQSASTGPLTWNGEGVELRPQGQTTSADAAGLDGADNMYWGRQIVATGWSAYKGANGSGGSGDPAYNQISALTFAEWQGTRSDSEDPRYRKVVLTENTATGGASQLTDPVLHLGGIAWYGHYLYATDVHTGSSLHGVTVFDLDHIVYIGANSRLVAAAHGAHYVMPVVARWISTGTGSYYVPGGSMSLDRGPTGPSLLIGAGSARPATEVMRFALHTADSAAGPTLVTDSGGTASAVAAYQLNNPVNDQGTPEVPSGVVSNNGVFYYHIENAHGTSSRLDAWNSTTGAHCSVTKWPKASEGLSFWHAADGDHLFGATANAGTRTAYDAQLTTVFPGGC